MPERPEDHIAMYVPPHKVAGLAHADPPRPSRAEQDADDDRPYPHEWECAVCSYLERCPHCGAPDHLTGIL